MTANLPDILQQTLARHALLAPGERVLVAVSGGADSMALLHLLHRAGHAGAVAHFDHQTRGGASAEDAAFVARAAAELGLPCFTGSEAIEARAAERRESFEMVAREERYAFFRETARANGFATIATGHHADDQAETVLLRLVRGTSPAGIAGIPPVRGLEGLHVIRPLLRCTRVQLVAWLRSEGLRWREDGSNEDPRFERNKIRRDLLPLLADEFNPRIRDALCRLAELQRMDQTLLDRLTADALATCQDPQGRILRTHFAALDQALQYRCLLRCIQDAGGQNDFETVQRATSALWGGNAGSQVDLGNNLSLYIASDHGLIARLTRATTQTPVTIPIPGEARAFGKIFRVRSLDRRPEEPLSRYCHPGRQLFDGSALGSALAIRHRQPGDRIQPLGMTGSRKLKDVFNDLGLTPPERDAQLLVESRGEIIWIPGHIIAARVAVTPKTTHVFELTIEPMSDTPL